ncbi:heparinase II/III family protein [Akkermansiaceae bacterium]|nr:heparinase II/III family protein [Akkermansiaceae bacterium]MDB4723747.1 heparinase II/III family protein [Akkermansiaceae bacterium]
MNLGQLFRTLRHLRFSQIFERIRYRIQRPLEFKSWFRVAARTTRRAGGSNLNWSQSTTIADFRPNKARIAEIIEDLDDDHLTLLNERLPFRGGDDWCMIGGRKSSRLWRYTLHYHRCLVELSHVTGNEDLVANHLTDWIDTCILGDVGFSHYPWNSYAIATRLDNWRQLIALLPEEFWGQRPKLKQAFSKSLYLQTQYLLDHLEWDLRGNHLLRDALGLASASSVIDGALKFRAKSTAINLVKSQIEEQILDDGCHFELSPMYHVEFMLDLIKLHQLLPCELLREQINMSLSKMWGYIVWLQHLDGTLAQFNDGSLVDLNKLQVMLVNLGVKAGQRTRKGARFFSDSGVFVSQSSRCATIMNAGKIAPSYQPGHAHADTFTIEISIDGNRVFIDPGTHSYDLNEVRSANRNTVSHNTVEIDGENSSEVWDIFRVGRRAEVFNSKMSFKEYGSIFESSHNGYRHLQGKPVHRREVICNDKTSTIIVTDEIKGSGRHRIKGGWLLSPEWSVFKHSNGWKIVKDNLPVSIIIEGAEQKDINLRVGKATHHPNYGLSVHTCRLEWSLSCELPAVVKMKITY